MKNLVKALSKSSLYFQVINVNSIRSLFQIKDVKHYSCVISEGNCSCGEDCVGESIINKQSVLAEHLIYFPDHKCEWKVLGKVPEYTKKRKFLEVFLMKSVKCIS